MFIVFQKQGSLQESQNVHFIHTETSVKIPKKYLGNSISTFYHICEKLVRLAGYEIEDIKLRESEIVIKFRHSIFDFISSLEELNKVWEEINDACKKVLTEYGCNEWMIELGIFEEENDFYDNVVMEYDQMDGGF